MFNALQRLLQAAEIARDPQITDLQIYRQDAFRGKMRASITPQLTFQVWLNHNPQHTRYSYQLLRQGEALLRWDNAPHYPQIKKNYPHHFHGERGDILPSSLKGKPLQDLPVVLEEIERYISN